MWTVQKKEGIGTRENAKESNIKRMEKKEQEGEKKIYLYEKIEQGYKQKKPKSNKMKEKGRKKRKETGLERPNKTEERTEQEKAK